AQEATVVALLEHIHILPIYAYGIVDNEFAYLAMRLLRGGSVADLLRKGPLPLPRAADIFTQVGRGLQYAHSKGVIHRDLKPSNILLDDGGNAYLSDFGLAKMIGSTINLTKSGNLVGTPAYVAPEQVRGEIADGRSDIYSLGILLYHMLVGRPPFELSEQGIAALLYQHVEEAPIPPHQLNPSITPAVEAVILRSLEKDPNQRYQTVEDMVQDFNLALGRKTRLRSFITLRTPERLKLIRQTRRVTPRRAALAIILMILLTVGAVAMFGSQPRFADKPVLINAGAHGTIADVTPNDAEIAAARMRLGDNGFIAFLACTLDNVTQATRAREMGDMATAFGLKYKVYNADNQAQTQITQFETARAEGAKAIILCPVNATSINDSIKSLQVANIPLAYITLYDNPYGVQMDSSSFDVGTVVGRLAGQIYHEEHNTPPQVVVLSYPGFPATDSRDDGMEAGLKESVPDVNFIGRVAGYTEDDSYQSIRELIEKKTHFDVILAINDVGAYGAVK
ncbi:MAG: protein kinase, partial [Chloroflexota bacterium]